MGGQIVMQFEQFEPEHRKYLHSARTGNVRFFGDEERRRASFMQIAAERN